MPCPGQPWTVRGYTATHLSAGDPVRRSWHLFEGVSFDGCPGFKGPDPQPVSMSTGSLWASTRKRQGQGRAVG